MQIWLASLFILPQAGSAPVPTDAPVEYEVYYHHTLRNKTDTPLTDVRVYLPVPSSDEYQQIADFRIEADRPVHITNRSDSYGTKMKRVTIARLDARQSARVGFSCVVRLHPPKEIALDPDKGASLDQIPTDIRDKYTVDQPSFGLQSPIIQGEAQRLLRECPNPVERAKAIHDFVAGSLKYKSGDGWDPAPVVMQRRSGSCSEFSYVFCALCRATGIPTRMVGGSIFPLKSEAPFTDKGWHRWVEAFLPGHGWVPFDPTLDRAAKPRQDFVGRHHPRVLILTRIGSRNTQLGLSYIGANSHTGQTARAREFVWSQGTMKRLADAKSLLENGRMQQGQTALRDLMQKFPRTRAGEEAARLLDITPPQSPTSPDDESDA